MQDRSRRHPSQFFARELDASTALARYPVEKRRERLSFDLEHRPRPHHPVPVRAVSRGWPLDDAALRFHDQFMAGGRLMRSCAALVPNDTVTHANAPRAVDSGDLESRSDVADDAERRP